VTLADRLAADALVRLLEKMRETGRSQGRIEVTVDAGRAQALRIVRIAESEVVAIKT
jgi:hypothetical protein